MVRWSNLPLELVEVIDSKITTYLDKVRIRMVCKSWRSRLSVLRQHAWLLHKPYGNAEGVHGLYNPIDDKFYEIDLKYAKEKYIKGCSYGWVAIFNDNVTEIKNPARQKVYLINMFTNAHVSLPSTEIRPHGMCQREIRKIVLSSPFADKNCIAVAIYKNAGEITYCKCGDRTWNHFVMNYGYDHVQDGIFHEDKLLVFERYGTISVYELTGPRAKLVTNIFKRYSNSRAACFVKSSTGGIILVCIIEHKNARPEFELYKIDVINKRMNQIYDIGDNNLFMDSTSAIMVPSTIGDVRNRIYVIKDITSPDSDIEKSCLIVFNLEKGTLRVLSHSKTSSEVLCRPNIWVKMN